MLAVTVPAADVNLLTAEELRLAVGLAADNAAKDSTLAPLGLRVSAAIARECAVAQGGVAPPTLRSETLTETIRPDVRRAELILSRAPLVSVTSVSEDGVALVPDDFEIDAAAAVLTRLSDDGGPQPWKTARVVVVYVAGWATVPDDLKAAAAALTRFWYFQTGRDPTVRSEEVPDVHKVSFTTPGAAVAEYKAVPPDVAAMLDPYRMKWFG